MSEFNGKRGKKKKVEVRGNERLMELKEVDET